MPGQDLPTTSYALLGLLALDGTQASGATGLTGYELKQRADDTMRFYWTAPAMSQVYAGLSRLSEHGLVHAETGHDQPTTYTISAAGLAAVRSWLADRSVGFPVFKHPVALRLMVGDLADTATLRTMLEDYLDELVRRRADLRAVRRSLKGADGPGQAFHHPSLVADWGLAHFASELRIARRTLDRLRGAEPDTQS